jgi:hypothetical protein
MTGFRSRKRLPLIMALCLLGPALSSISCSGQEAPRQYQEVVLVPSGPSHGLEWKTPPGWQTVSGDPMRIATFAEGSGPDRIECSLVALPGEAGGLKANVSRWMIQLKLTPLSDAELGRFIGRQRKFFSDGGLPVQVIDLTGLTLDGSASVLGAAVTTLEGTVFAKLSGSRAGIEANRGRFFSLVQSLQQKEEPR